MLFVVVYCVPKPQCHMALPCRDRLEIFPIILVLSHYSCTVPRGGSREGVEGVATPCFVRTQGRQDSSQARPA